VVVLELFVIVEVGSGCAEKEKNKHNCQYENNYHYGSVIGGFFLLTLPMFKNHYLAPIFSLFSSAAFESKEPFAVVVLH